MNPDMPIARGSLTWILVPAALTLAATLAALTLGWGWWIAAAFLLLTTLFLANFYRDPERTPADGLVAPADGIVQTIDERDGQLRIVTFMNPLNVHVNRAPLDARVLRVEHVNGGYVPAFKKEAERNERVEWDLETEIGPVRMVQIAGTVARRIVPYVQAGETIKKGDRVGMIRLGSRVDLYLPKGLPVAVKTGDKVHAGSTTLVRLEK